MESLKSSSKYFLKYMVRITRIQAASLISNAALGADTCKFKKKILPVFLMIYFGKSLFQLHQYWCKRDDWRFFVKREVYRNRNWLIWKNTHVDNIGSIALKVWYWEYSILSMELPSTAFSSMVLPSTVLQTTILQSMVLLNTVFLLTVLRFIDPTYSI